MPVMQSWSLHDSFPAGTSVGMRVSGHRDGRKGSVGGAEPGDEVVVKPVMIGGRSAGTLTRIPGRTDPHQVLWHTLTRRDPRTPCGG